MYFCSKVHLLAGIYIHIPFCKKACHYCDFHFSTTLNLVDKVVDSIVLEAEKMANYLNEPVETIYFGGGTPSLLSNAQIKKILFALNKNYTIAKKAEITLEANPDDLNEKKIGFLAKQGINRLSIGTQSFSNSVLTFLNRSHSAIQTLLAVNLCKKYGITNINLDLIYGIPNQSAEQWKQNLEQLVALNITHISCYALTIEDKTVFGNWHKKGKLLVVNDDLITEEYEYMVNYLSSKGFNQYEVSNFSKPNFISQHNASYWHQKPYVGLGPGAHSFTGNSRKFNFTNNSKYCKLIQTNKNPFSTEILSLKEQLTEYIFTRIRTAWGIDFNKMSDTFNYQLTDYQQSYIGTLIDKKMATLVNNKFILNYKGLFVSDAVTLELIPH